jgi:hypothetical protein
LVTYAVIDAQTGSIVSSHQSLDAAREDADQTAERRESLSINVFDDTGYNGGECCEYSRSPRV